MAGFECPPRLERRRAQLERTDASLWQECGGLLASAHKRRAELLFTRAELFPSRRDQDLANSRTALEQALAAYRETFRALPQSHWNGIQQLALEAALTGQIAKPSDWELVCAFARALRDGQPMEYWASGTLIEALLLAPIAGKTRDLEAVRSEVKTMRIRGGHDPHAIPTTLRQIRRYGKWWTKENGYFSATDLSQDAKQIIEWLVEESPIVDAQPT